MLKPGVRFYFPYIDLRQRERSRGVSAEGLGAGAPSFAEGEPASEAKRKSLAGSRGRAPGKFLRFENTPKDENTIEKEHRLEETPIILPN